MPTVRLQAVAAALALVVTSAGTSVSETLPTAAGSGREWASFNPAFQTGKSFTVTWGGATDSESGVASYSVTVRRAPFNGTFGAPHPFKTDALAAPADPVVAAAGDIACGSGSGIAATTCKELKTSDLLVQMNPAAVLSLGDLQYQNGEYVDFLNGKPGVPGTGYDPTWGRLKSITRPAVGNHEYDDPAGGAKGYYDYFNGIANFTGPAGDRDKGYYSFDIGSWHIISLNSNCGDVGGCVPGSLQYRWLSADLAAHQNSCTLAYWHIPLFSSGGRGETNSAHFWQLLYAHGADLILNGHDHIYERFAPQTHTGARDDARGIRQFTVGTGGKDLTEIVAPEPNSLIWDTTSFGVLKLTLHPKSYDWQFVPIAGQTFTDSGSSPCNGLVADTTPPTAPTMGVAGATGSATFTGEPGSTYCFRATATDWDGNTSPASAEDCTAVPVDNVSFRHRGGWLKKRGDGHYLETFSQTKRLGATLTLHGVTAKHLAIIVTKCPKCGAIEVFFGGKRMRKINLRSSAMSKLRVIDIKTFDAAQTGTVKVRVVTRNKLVRIEGLGVSAA
jgi:acid phosphatase type 7